MGFQIVVLVGFAMTNVNHIKVGLSAISKMARLRTLHDNQKKLINNLVVLSFLCNFATVKTIYKEKLAKYHPKVRNISIH